MTRGSTRCAEPPSAPPGPWWRSASWGLARLGRGHRRRTDDRCHRPRPAGRRAPCGSWSRCPATGRDRPRQRRGHDRRQPTSRPRPAAASESSRRAADGDPGDRHEQQHARAADRRGQEGGPGLPRRGPRQRLGRRPHLRRHVDVAVPPGARPGRRPQRRRRLSSPATPRSTTGSSARSRPPARRRERRPAQDPGALRRQGHHRPRPWTTCVDADQGVRGVRSTSSPCSRATRRTQPLNAIASAGKGTCSPRRTRRP